MINHRRILQQGQVVIIPPVPDITDLGVNYTFLATSPVVLMCPFENGQFILANVCTTDPYRSLRTLAYDTPSNPGVISEVLPPEYPPTSTPFQTGQTITYASPPWMHMSKGNMNSNNGPMYKYVNVGLSTNNALYMCTQEFGFWNDVSSSNGAETFSGASKLYSAWMGECDYWYNNETKSANETLIFIKYESSGEQKFRGVWFTETPDYFHSDGVISSILNEITTAKAGSFAKIVGVAQRFLVGFAIVIVDPGRNSIRGLVSRILPWALVDYTYEFSFADLGTGYSLSGDFKLTVVNFEERIVAIADYGPGTINGVILFKWNGYYMDPISEIYSLPFLNQYTAITGINENNVFAVYTDDVADSPQRQVRMYQYTGTMPAHSFMPTDLMLDRQGYYFDVLFKEYVYQNTSPNNPLNAPYSTFINADNTYTSTLLFNDYASFPVTGVANTLYIDDSTKNSFIWNGSSYYLFDTTIETIINLGTGASIMIPHAWPPFESGPTHGFNYLIPYTNGNSIRAKWVDLGHNSYLYQDQNTNGSFYGLNNSADTDFRRAVSAGEGYEFHTAVELFQKGSLNNGSNILNRVALLDTFAPGSSGGYYFCFEFDQSNKTLYLNHFANNYSGTITPWVSADLTALLPVAPGATSGPKVVLGFSQQEVPLGSGNGIFKLYMNGVEIASQSYSGITFADLTANTGPGGYYLNGTPYGAVTQYSTKSLKGKWWGAVGVFGPTLLTNQERTDLNTYFQGRMNP